VTEVPTLPRQQSARNGPAAPGTGLVPVAVLGREAMLRAGVGALLGSGRGLSMVGEAADAADAAALLLREPVRVLVVLVEGEADPRLPGLLDWVAGRVPDCRVVVLADAASSEDAIFRALRAGARAVVDRAAEPAELVAAVHAVAAGGAVLAPKVAGRLLDRFAGIDIERCTRAGALVGTLSEREREVLDLVARGYGNARIARALFLSQGAVKAVISRLLTKLCCQNRVQIACIAQAAEMLGRPLAN
jgi:DNA-binding NarL/FixJ family response regulator